MSNYLMDRDRDHMKRFPAQQKENILRAIMELPAADEQVCDGSHCYENTVAKLRAHGYQLIDLSPQERAFTAVWYRKSTSWLGLRATEHVAMLTWEANGNDEQTTLHTWQL